MKNLYIFTLLLCVTTPVLGQINTYVPKEKTEEKISEEVPVILYDSLRQLTPNSKMREQLIGQQLYYPQGTSALFLYKTLKKIPLSNLPALNIKAHIKKGSSTTEKLLVDIFPDAMVYTNMVGLNKQSAYNWPWSSLEEAISDKYYIVTDVRRSNDYRGQIDYNEDDVIIINGTRISLSLKNGSYRYGSSGKKIDKPLVIDRIVRSDQEVYRVSNPIRGSSEYIIEMVDIQSQDTVITSVMGISTAFFEKVKQTYEGKKFVVENDIKSIRDRISNKDIIITDRTYTCTQIAVYDRSIIAVFENDSGTITKSVGTQLIHRSDNPNVSDEEWRNFTSVTRGDHYHYRHYSDRLPPRPSYLISSTMQELIPKEYIDQIDYCASRIYAYLQEDEAAETAKNNASRKAFEAEQEAYRNRCISMYGQKFGNLVFNNKIEIGMTQEMCKRAWFTPSETVKDVDSSGTKELWYYNKDFIGNARYIIFSDGIVVKYGYR